MTLPPLSPTVKVVLVAVGVAGLQAAADYLKTDVTPTFAEGLHAIGAGAFGAFLYWLRGPQTTK